VGNVWPWRSSVCRSWNEWRRAPRLAQVGGPDTERRLPSAKVQSRGLSPVPKFSCCHFAPDRVHWSVKSKRVILSTKPSAKVKTRQCQSLTRTTNRGHLARGSAISNSHKVYYGIFLSIAITDTCSKILRSHAVWQGIERRAQLRLNTEPRDGGFAEPVIGPRFARARWRPQRQALCAGAGNDGRF
jgi:hypothetical protein